MMKVVFVFLFCLSCAKQSPVVAPLVLTPDHYTLEKREKIDHPDPLPDEMRIDVVWHFPDGTLKKVPGYVAWDLNGDNRYDLIDVLDMKQQVTARAFDYNLDGKVDEILDLVNRM